MRGFDRRIGVDEVLDDLAHHDHVDAAVPQRQTWARRARLAARSARGSLAAANEPADQSSPAKRCPVLRSAATVVANPSPQPDVDDRGRSLDRAQQVGQHRGLPTSPVRARGRGHGRVLVEVAQLVADRSRSGVLRLDSARRLPRRSAVRPRPPGRPGSPPGPWPMLHRPPARTRRPPPTSAVAWPAPGRPGPSRAGGGHRSPAPPRPRRTRLRYAPAARSRCARSSRAGRER